MLLFVILWLYARKPRPRMAVGGMFALRYGCARFFTEYLPHAGLPGVVRRHTDSAGQMLSLPMILAGALMLFITYQRYQSSARSSKVFLT